MSDLTVGANLSFIRRDRGRRGGGVAIGYDPTKIRLKKFSTYNNTDTEIVCAVGNCPLTQRKIALISVYLPPQLVGQNLIKAVETIVDLSLIHI